jgi:hypothetical protein
MISRDLRQPAGGGRLHKLRSQLLSAAEAASAASAIGPAARPLRSHLRVDATPWGWQGSPVAPCRRLPAYGSLTLGAGGRQPCHDQQASAPAQEVLTKERPLPRRRWRPPPPRRRRGEARPDKDAWTNKDARPKKAVIDEATIEAEARPNEAAIKARADKRAIEAPLEAPPRNPPPPPPPRWAEAGSDPKAANEAIATRETRKGDIG